MRRLTKALLLILLCTCALLDPEDRSLNVASTQSEKPLHLTVKVVSEQYCIGDSELDGLRLSVRLVYTNQGKETIILYKGSTDASRVMISSDFANAAAKRFEVDSHLTHARSGGEKCYKGDLPSTCFVSLQPKASYELESIIGVFAVRGDAREITGAVKSGDHVLQIEVPTWHESNELAEQLGSRWRQHGILWSKPVTSEPLLFTVKKNRSVKDCP